MELFNGGVLEFSPLCNEWQNETTMLSMICTAQKRHIHVHRQIWRVTPTANIMVVFPVLNSWRGYVFDCQIHNLENNYLIGKINRHLVCTSTCIL